MPVDVLPTLSTYLPALSLSVIVTVASGLSSPVSAGVLPSPKSSALRRLERAEASLTFSSSKRSMGLPLNVPAHLSPFVNENVPFLFSMVTLVRVRVVELEDLRVAPALHLARVEVARVAARRVDARLALDHHHLAALRRTCRT